MDTSAINLGMICCTFNHSRLRSSGVDRSPPRTAFYYISYLTVETFSLSLRERTKLKGLLEIVASATEFESLPIRQHEDVILQRIYDRVPVKLDTVDFNSPHFKAFLLLQAHFARMPLPSDLASDQLSILPRTINLLSACVDVMSSQSYLNAVGAMDLTQMVVQAMWDTDSALRQVPYFDAHVIARCEAANASSVYDIMELDDDVRDDLLNLDTKQM